MISIQSKINVLGIFLSQYRPRSAKLCALAHVCVAGVFTHFHWQQWSYNEWGKEMASEDGLKYFYLVHYVRSHKELNMQEWWNLWSPDSQNTICPTDITRTDKLNTWNSSAIWQCLTVEYISAVSAEEKLSLSDFHVGSFFFQIAICLRLFKNITEISTLSSTLEEHMED